MTYAIMYAVRSVTDKSLYRSRHESFSRGTGFQEAQLWSNPKTAAKEARYQEERRRWSQDCIDRKVYGDDYNGVAQYMGACEVVEVRIPEPA